MQRDRDNNKKLRDAGWKVLRVWEHELKNDLDDVVLRIRSELSRAQ